jgi:hypothetical protein
MVDNIEYVGGVKVLLKSFPYSSDEVHDGVN